MSGELQTDYITGKTVYFLLRTATGTIWNGSSFAAYVTANYATYPIAATEQGSASAFYVGNMPAAAAGTYSVVAKLQVGGSPAETDTSIGWGTLQWDGSFVPAPISSGILYLASGCLSGQPITLLSGYSYTASGIWHASGVNVVVPTSIISGTWPASGANTVVPISIISGTTVVVVASTLSGGIYLASGCLSGQLITLLSGYSYTASGIWHASGANTVVPISTISGANTVVPISTISGVNSVVPISTVSGINAVVPITTISGIFIASGIWPASGANVVVPISTVSGTWPASGANTVVPISTVSGITVVVPGSTLSGLIYLASGSLSGQQVILTSGQSYTASGIWPASGANSAASISSGGVYLASGHFLFGSGQYFLGSGSITSGLIASGTVFVASGAYTASTITSGGVFLASGHFLFGSGQYFLASGSITSGTLASGMISNAIPDAIFTRDFSGIGTPAARSLLNATRKLINKWDTVVASGKVTVYKEDDTTVAFTQNYSVSSGALPITELG